MHLSAPSIESLIIFCFRTILHFNATLSSTSSQTFEN